MDILVIVAVIVVLIYRLVIMKGNFVLPTFYKEGNNVSFNLGSITTIIVGLVAAFVLMQSQPELFANWYVAAITAYTAPQIVDGTITAVTRYKYDSNIDKDTVEQVEVFGNDDEEEGGA